MSLKLLRPSPALTSLSLQSTRTPFSQQTRPFISSFTQSSNSTSTQQQSTTISANRLLPFPTYKIYEIIADINSYPTFLPLCTSASVTSYSKPDPHYNVKWPQTASLGIGLADRGINETFTSKVYCVPPVKDLQGRAGVGIVEAISGLEAGESTLALDDISHHDHATEAKALAEGEKVKDSPLAALRTRWTVKGYPFKDNPLDGKSPVEGTVEPEPKAVEMTNVSLVLEYRFKNSLYELLAKGVSDALAEKMVEAFEKRVRSLLKEGHLYK